MPTPLIFHVDVNSAFLSWESAHRLSEDPDAQDLRLINAVIGVQTGEPLAHARKKCPDLVIAPPNHALYAEYSKRFISILEEVAPTIEQCSIDEAFCDMTGTTKLYGDPILFAHNLKDRIYHELGFTVNIGISTNKLLAKMASDFKKPNLVHTLFPEEIPTKLWPLPLEDLFGIGKSTAKRLHSLGFKTIGDLAHANKQYLISNFKSQGEYIWNSANGIASADLTYIPPANKGYGNSVTLPYDVTDTETANKILLSLCEAVGARIRAEQAYISVVQVQIVDCEFVHHSRQTTLPSTTNVTEKIYACAKQLFAEGWDHTPIR